MKHVNKFAICALLFVAPYSAIAQLPAFEAEIDCGGVFIAGDTVPFRIRFENQTLETISLENVLAIDIPVLGSRTLREFSLALGPDQDLAIRRRLNLPATAPSGNYTMSITASSPDEIGFDTCSFDVQ